MLSSRVEELGLGVVLPPDAPTEALAAAIRRTLEDPVLPKRAQRFATVLTDHPGLDDAIGIVEGLLEGWATTS